MVARLSSYLFARNVLSRKGGPKRRAHRPQVSSIHLKSKIRAQAFLGLQETRPALL